MKAVLAASLLLAACVHSMAPAAGLVGAAEAGSALVAAGHTEVRKVEFDDGMWEAEVRRADGHWGEVHIERSRGEIFDRQAASKVLDADAIRLALEVAGYRAIGPLDRDGATSDADATDSRGQRVELRVSGKEGRILHSDHDGDD